MRITRRPKSTHLAIAILAFVAAGSGTATAAVIVSGGPGGSIRDNTVQGIDVKTGSVNGTDLQDNTATGADVKNKSLAAADISSVPAPRLRSVVASGPSSAVAVCPRGTRPTGGSGVLIKPSIQAENYTVAPAVNGGEDSNGWSDSDPYAPDGWRADAEFRDDGSPVEAADVIVEVICAPASGVSSSQVGSLATDANGAIERLKRNK